jgi:hypothetical protein
MGHVREQPTREVLLADTQGRAQLRLETASWTRYAYAVFAALEAPPQAT